MHYYLPQIAVLCFTDLDDVKAVKRYFTSLSILLDTYSVLYSFLSDVVTRHPHSISSLPPHQNIRTLCLFVLVRMIISKEYHLSFAVSCSFCSLSVFHLTCDRLARNSDHIRCRSPVNFLLVPSPDGYSSPHLLDWRQRSASVDLPRLSSVVPRLSSMGHSRRHHLTLSSSLASRV